MTWRRRIRLFIRDYLDEFGVAWSLARTRDCYRNGGHRWQTATSDVAVKLGMTHECSRCGVSELRPATTHPIYATTTVNTGYTITNGGWS